jgi:hypothetical protein
MRSTRSRWRRMKRASRRRGIYVIASDMGAGGSKIPRGEDLEPYIVHWWLAKTVRKHRWGLHL